jgi:hypothetical protein
MNDEILMKLSGKKNVSFFLSVFYRQELVDLINKRAKINKKGKKKTFLATYSHLTFFSVLLLCLTSSLGILTPPTPRSLALSLTQISKKNEKKSRTINVDLSGRHLTSQNIIRIV